MVSSVGMVIWPRSSIVMVLPLTLATAWSSVQVVLYQPCQNQSRSRPLTFSNVFHISHGYGCLYFQRCAYARYARMKVSSPNTARSAVSTDAGLSYEAMPYANGE